jgi:hypothetical protein
MRPKAYPKTTQGLVGAILTAARAAADHSNAVISVEVKRSTRGKLSWQVEVWARRVGTDVCTPFGDAEQQLLYDADRTLDRALRHVLNRLRLGNRS